MNSSSVNAGVSTVNPIAGNSVDSTSSLRPNGETGPTTEERLRAEVLGLRKLRDEALTLLSRTHYRQDNNNNNNNNNAASNTSNAPVNKGAAVVLVPIVDEEAYTDDRLALITRAENERLRDSLQRLSLENKTNSAYTGHDENEVWLASAKSTLEKDIFDIEELIRSLKKPKVEEEVTEEVRGSQLLKTELTAIKSRQGAAAAFTSHMASTKSPAHARRTIRTIEQDLIARIEMLKNSQPDMEAFLGRIQEYKDEQRRRAKNDIVVANCARIKQYKKEARQDYLHKRRIEHDRHIKEVVESKKARDEEQRLRVEREMAERERLAGMSKAARESQARIQREAEVRQKWFYLVLIGSRLYSMQRAVLDQQLFEEARLRREKAAFAIQRAWQNYLARITMKRIATAKVTLARFIRLYLPRLRNRLRRQAAETITTFLTDSHTASRLMNVIKRFRLSVIQAQQQARTIITVRRHQYQLIQQQWDKYEPIWWERRLRIALNATSDQKINGSKGNLAPGRKGRYRPVAAADTSTTPFKVPEAIRNRLIRQRLKQICTQYRDIYWDHMQKRKEWYDEYRLRMTAFSNLTGTGDLDGQRRFAGTTTAAVESTQNQSLVVGTSDRRLSTATTVNLESLPHVEGLRVHPKTGRPLLMTNCVLLSATEMIALIEKGYAEATAEKK